MLVFGNVRYKNILATGNAWTTIDLSAHRETLIVGKNGAGKTTILDVLCFGLFGKPFRNINKPLLVNSVNNKELLVEIEFATMGHNYLVRRGIKPNIFEIEVDGRQLEKRPDTKDEQEYLERHILKCNYKAFTQIVILGSSSYVPFMRLTPQYRRDVVEDVLDIRVFGIMHTLLKSQQSELKDLLVHAKHELALIEQRHIMAKNYAEQWAQQQEDARKDIDAQLVQLDSDEATINTQVETLNQRLVEWKPIAAKLDDHQTKLTKAKGILQRLLQQKEHLTQSHSFFTEHEQCPTCTQVISDEFKGAQFMTIDEQLATVTTKIDELKKGIPSIESKVSTARKAAQTVSTINVEHAKTIERLKNVATSRARLNDARAKTYDPPPQITEELGDLDAATEKVNSLIYKQSILEHGASILKDNGIRTKIVDHHLPLINRWLNHYLDALDFPVQFTLDGQFNETIKSRHRDEFSYENFSDGQKKRIDLALTLTWRAVARMKNSVSTNIMIFDEVFDSSLDADGVEAALRMIQKLEPDTRIIVISPKETMLDRFSRVLEVRMEKGFSTTEVMA